MYSQQYTLEKKLSKYASRKSNSRVQEVNWRGESHGITCYNCSRLFLLILENMLEAMNPFGFKGACTLPPYCQGAVEQTGLHF